jgi:hypothetical protein
MYNNECKIKCDKINNNEECTSNERENDCFLLEGTDDGNTPAKCINRVCYNCYYN